VYFVKANELISLQLQRA